MLGPSTEKNPGAAVPVELDRLVMLDLNGDKMLPTFGNRFVDGYALANKAIPPNAYVRV